MRDYELRVAIVAALKAHAGLAALLSTDPVDGSVAVYDHAPQDATFPYLVIDPPSGTDHDTDNTLGWDGELTINSWSRFRGFEEIGQIQRQTDEALNRTEPTVVDGTIVTLHRVNSDSVLDDDGLTRHGIQRFRVIIEET